MVGDFLCYNKRNNSMKTLESLYQSLKERKRPEDIAAAILVILEGQLHQEDQQLLQKAAQGALKYKPYGYTSMSQTFAKPSLKRSQLNTALELFGLEEEQKLAFDSEEEVLELIAQLNKQIHKVMGENDFLTHRLNKVERKALGWDISKRQYNKRWRVVKRLEKKVNKLTLELKKIELQKVGKHGLFHLLEWEEFSKDLNTACFIAYYNARCNLRSIFTNSSQARPYDEIADRLFQRCCGMVRKKTFWGRVLQTKQEEPVTTNWLAIAYGYTSQEVLEHLTEEEKGKLLGTWTQLLEEIALMLGNLWAENDINRKTMIVQRGNDSTTWNNTASAWNKARDQWMNLIYSLGLESLLEQLCFGKVLRLMAADVAAWHRRSGGGLEPNTEVWNQLPLPWEVFQGQAQCTRQMVVHACAKVGLDPEKSGWIAPKKHGIAAFTPTPELVHGVAVHNAFLATILRQQGYFSGKPKKIQPHQRHTKL